jgi:hypothetical protein
MEVKSILGLASTFFSSCSDSLSDETVFSARSRETAFRESREPLLLLLVCCAILLARRAGLREVLPALRYAHLRMHELPSEFAMRRRARGHCY